MFFFFYQLLGYPKVKFEPSLVIWATDDEVVH